MDETGQSQAQPHIRGATNPTIHIGGSVAGGVPMEDPTHVYHHGQVMPLKFGAS